MLYYILLQHFLLIFIIFVKVRTVFQSIFCLLATNAKNKVRYIVLVSNFFCFSETMQLRELLTLPSMNEPSPKGLSIFLRALFDHKYQFSFAWTFLSVLLLKIGSQISTTNKLLNLKRLSLSNLL